MKMCVLCENYVKSKGLLAEHGFSLYIESKGKKILFDMGQSDVFFKNAKQLEIKLENLDYAVLSHGHYDHGGGVQKLFEIAPNLPLYINNLAFGDFYSKNGYIGVDKSISKNKNVVFTEGEKELSEGIKLVSGTMFEMKEKSFSNGLKKQTDSGKEPDDFAHEQYLVIEENNKKILISGCSHKGILNLLDYFNPDFFVGGLHLSDLNVDSQDFLNVSQKMKEYGTKYFVCHCTGILQYSALKSVLKDKIEYIYCGSKAEI